MRLEAILLLAAAIWAFILLLVISLCKAAKAGDQVMQDVYRESGFEDGEREVASSARDVEMVNFELRLRRRAARWGSEQRDVRPWEAVVGLIWALDTRDPRIGRHAAGVAQFARDIARSVGMCDRDCELAYTAGLLHDIGHLALSDRVHERGAELTEKDWIAVWRHPELGAKLLEDLGMPEQVVQTVLTHHERPDGRGYPDGLSSERIPEIAKIVAVAEAYDILTAPDTYRTPVSSFEALRELRRVAETQLDGRYVDALAAVLHGQRLGERHADAGELTSRFV